MGDEQHLDAVFQQRGHDLAGDLGSLPLVGAANDSLHKEQAAGRDLVGDPAHPGQFLVELPLVHGLVFFPVVMGEDTVAYVHLAGVGRRRTFRIGS